jgi:formate hydrogenlyase transcriptional activator
VAPTDSIVLISGETGTGKELLARAIHNLSSRKAKSMVTVNCSALPPTLIENELFGREKGAYTGALSSQMGRFEVAHKSTLFLDEISELTPELQVKLLRVLEEGKFERLGSTKTLTVDVRIITATNRDLSREVEKGNFREDLYYRLNVFPIPIPPLRERSEDIPLLVWAFVKEFSEQMGRRVDTISLKSIERLRQYPWPGNVRQLRNAVEHAMILNQGPKLAINPPENRGQLQSLGATIADVERSHIKKILDQTGGRVRGQNGAAKILGLKPTTLEYRMKKLEVNNGS